MPDHPHKLLLSPKEACHLLNLGRSHLFKLLATGELRSIKVGKLRRIPFTELTVWIERQPPFAPAGAAEDSREDHNALEADPREDKDRR